MACTTYTRSQLGATLTESSLSLLIFCLIFLGLIESAHWLLLRQALNQALFNTARIAVTQQAHPQIIQQAFEEQLQALRSFVRPSPQTYWQIHHSTLAQATTPVRNNYQALQFSAGNSAIFDQNTLVLKLLYAHKPLTPLVRTVVAWAHHWQQASHDALAERGFIPIVTTVQLPMQSDQPTSYTGQRQALAFNQAMAGLSSATTPLRSLGWQSTGPALGAWRPTPTTPPNLLTDAQCDKDHCCGPLF
ncbi:TadE/TadG family type IV pilus assembly protein [Paenalcaligenes hominis]|uniref:TadE/TadG family type IV pilus assembly protein n=1 Tax=Paenalcaligenes hominis TaxID=643674 RepID=UPI003523454B